MRVYKLTDQNMCTRDGECKWVLGEKKRIADRPELCRVGFHAYSDPLLAIACNPIHANIPSPRLFEVEARGEHDEDVLQSCWQEMTLLAESPVPKITVAQFVRWAIYCAQAVYHSQLFDPWAERWLSGEDRTKASAVEEARATAWRTAAWATAWTAEKAASAAAWAAAWKAVWAAEKAIWTETWEVEAWAATWAATWASTWVAKEAVEAAEKAIWAEIWEAAAWATAWAAAWAAQEAAGAARGQRLDVLALLRQAIAEEK